MKETHKSCALMLGILAENLNSGGSSGPFGFSGSGAAAAAVVILPAETSVPRPARTSSSLHT